jgi:ribosomal protein S18 acetylase RimI-like enzyme
MASGVSIEVLDLRHFAAPLLRPVLEAEGEVWRQRLHWDYRASAKLLLQYFDSHMLPGYVALESGQVTGYVFCVYEETKAVIGDVFAMPEAGGTFGAGPQREIREIEETLLKHLFETLLNSPQLNRIESQLLLHPSETHAGIFRQAGFEVFRRLFMVRQLESSMPEPHADPGAELELRPWRDDDLNAAGRLIAESYQGHTDSRINDQYCSVHGSMRFLHNIARYSGCGVFAPQVSHVVLERRTHEMIALILGSRVSPQSGHITQLCVHQRYRRRGLARMLLTLAAWCFVRQGASEISLTVTESNTEAVNLYLADEYTTVHTFDAAVWQRN